MGYNGNINRKLRTVEINDDDECLYKLAYDKDKRSYFKRKDILNYVNEHYLENENIVEEDLLNDLNTFKTYRDDVEQISNNQDNISKIFSLILTILSTILGVIGKKLIYENNLLYAVIWILMIVVAYINMIFNIFKTTSKSESAKLKYINNAIYTLEAIKEDVDKYENSRAKYKAMQNKYSPRLCMREKDVKKN